MAYIVTYIVMAIYSYGLYGYGPISLWPYIVMASVVSTNCVVMAYRADWEPAAASGWRVRGMSWGCPAALWGPSTPSPTQVSWKNPHFEKLADFPVSCGYVMDWLRVAQVRFWRPKRPHSEKTTCRLATPLS